MGYHWRGTKPFWDEELSPGVLWPVPPNPAPTPTPGLVDYSLRRLPSLSAASRKDGGET